MDESLEERRPGGEGEHLEEGEQGGDGDLRLVAGDDRAEDRGGARVMLVVAGGGGGCGEGGGESGVLGLGTVRGVQLRDVAGGEGGVAAVGGADEGVEP